MFTHFSSFRRRSECEGTDVTPGVEFLPTNLIGVAQGKTDWAR